MADMQAGRGTHMGAENYQWTITDYGLETQSGQVEHAIPAAGLFDTCVCDDEMYLAALIDNMGRDRVIRDKFLDIYPKALAHHAVRLKRPVDDDCWRVHWPPPGRTTAG